MGELFKGVYFVQPVVNWFKWTKWLWLSNAAVCLVTWIFRGSPVKNDGGKDRSGTQMQFPMQMNLMKKDQTKNHLIRWGKKSKDKDMDMDRRQQQRTIMD